MSQHELSPETAFRQSPTMQFIAGIIRSPLATGATVIAIERSRDFADELARQYPDMHVVKDCASQLRHHSKQFGWDGADSIVSALPWTNLPEPLQENILREAAAFLRDDGVFVTISCFGLHLTPTGRRFRRLLESLFSSVERRDLILRNIPPAFIYRCLK